MSSASSKKTSASSDHIGKALQDLLDENASQYTRPDETTCTTLTYTAEMSIVTALGVSHRDVQLQALHSNIIPERYVRNQHSISTDEQIRLLQSHVAVIGLGGLGGTVTDILARIGIGHLTLVDGDHFEDSNLNRQLLSSVTTLGRKKAEAAADHVARVNPAITTRVITKFFDQENSDDILNGIDVGVDCLDNIQTRFLLEAGCRRHQIPLVSAAIGGSTGQATVIFPADEGLQMIYGPPDTAPKKGIESRLGTLPFAATAMAAIECAEIVALAAGHEAPLRRKLLMADFKDQQMHLLSLG